MKEGSIIWLSQRAVPGKANTMCISDLGHRAGRRAHSPPALTCPLFKLRCHGFTQGFTFLGKGNHSLMFTLRKKVT